MAETNQLKWRGIRPVHPLENIQTHPGPFETTVAGKTRVQILKQKAAATTTAIVHTVPFGKTLYLTAAHSSIRHSATAFALLHVRDAGDTNIFYILYIHLIGGGAEHAEITFPMPLVVPALYDVAIIANAGTAHGVIFGWEE